MSLTRRHGIELIATARANLTPPATRCPQGYPPGPRSARACPSRALPPQRGMRWRWKPVARGPVPRVCYAFCSTIASVVRARLSPNPRALCFLLHHTREDTENLLVNRLMSLSWAVARGPVPCVPQLGRVGGTSFSLLPIQKKTRGGKNPRAPAEQVKIRRSPPTEAAPPPL